MRDSLLHTNIVRTAAGTMAPIQSADGKKNIWFPSGPTKRSGAAFGVAAGPGFPNRLPALSDVELWQDILWPECGKFTLDQVAEFIEKPRINRNADSRSSREKMPTQWLNEFYATLKLSEPDFLAVVAKRRIFPNQNGTFKKKAELSRDAGNIDPALLDILQLLGTDLRDELLAPEIVTDLDDLSTKDGSLRRQGNLGSDRRAHPRPQCREALPPGIRPTPAVVPRKTVARKDALPILYRNKHHLYDDDEIVDNIEHAEQLNELLKHYNVKTVDELHTVIEKQTGGSKLLPVTEEIIASLGITSVEEWKKALEDKNLAALFAHESTPTTDMFVYAQSLIQTSKGQRDRPLIDARRSTTSPRSMRQRLPSSQESSMTAGTCNIVVRPAYDGTVIIYYQSEKDVLDYEDHELWVDTGKDVRRITFGHILKTTEIRRFPI